MFAGFDDDSDSDGSPRLAANSARGSKGRSPSSRSPSVSPRRSGSQSRGSDKQSGRDRADSAPGNESGPFGLHSPSSDRPSSSPARGGERPSRSRGKSISSLGETTGNVGKKERGMFADIPSPLSDESDSGEYDKERKGSGALSGIQSGIQSEAMSFRSPDSQMNDDDEEMNREINRRNESGYVMHHSKLNVLPSGNADDDDDIDDIELPPTPPGRPHPALVARMDRFFQLREQGKHLNDSIHGSRDYGNPYILQHVINTFGIDEYATNFQDDLPMQHMDIRIRKSKRPKLVDENDDDHDVGKEEKGGRGEKGGERGGEKRSRKDSGGISDKGNAEINEVEMRDADADDDDL